jgi:hypothetical protein
MYGDITQFPFIVFHYPPVYHLVIGVIAPFNIDQVAAGRETTVAATIAIAMLAGGIVSTSMRETGSIIARIVGATVSGLVVFTYHPVQVWAVMMRVDMLAIGFSMAGIYITIVAGQRLIPLCGAALMFLLSVYTKQTELAAPMAAMFVAMILNVRSAIKASTFGVLVGGVAFIILQLSSGGRFWHHIFEYNLNRFPFQQLVELISEQKPDALGVLVGVLSFTYLWWTEGRAIRKRNIRGWIDGIRKSRRLRALTVTSLWFGLATVQLVSLGKSGLLSITSSNGCASPPYPPG